MTGLGWYYLVKLYVCHTHGWDCQYLIMCGRTYISAEYMHSMEIELQNMIIEADITDSL